MKFGLERINEITEKMVKKELPYIDNIVIGENSSGKSLLLKKFIEKCQQNSNVYFIDAVNRGFDVKKASKIKDKPEFDMAVLKTRLGEAYFNLADSFSFHGTSTECAEMIYGNYEEDVQKLFYSLTGDKFSIVNGDPLGEVDFGDGKGLLSSGYQEIIRILLELLYYQDTVIQGHGVNHAWIVVDELDEFLSPKYSALIMEFLKEKFSWARWVVATHSCDLVAHTSEANLVILDNNVCEVVDINDYSSISEVQIIFGRLFGERKVMPSETEEILRHLLNNKINGAWGSYEEEWLNKLQKKDLSASQKIILQQIQRW